jgi:hypothetical protein
MREVRFLFAIILVTFSLIAAAEAAMNFNCSIGPDPYCGCVGKSDCADMRHSGMCSGPLLCSVNQGQVVCTCTTPKTQGGVVKHPPTSGAKQKQ